MKSLSIVLLFMSGVAGTGRAADMLVADAVQNRDIATLRTLLKQHASVNVRQEDGTTALHWAAHWNDVESVNLLIHAGADAKAVNRYGATPLSEAAALSNPTVSVNVRSMKRLMSSEMRWSGLSAASPRSCMR